MISWDSSRLLMMVMFSGWCSFELMLVFSVSGSVLSMVVVVVIMIGWKCSR